MKNISKILVVFILFFLQSEIINAQAGSPDSTFGNNGIVIINDSAGPSYSIILPDSKILFMDSYFGVNLRRFTPDGNYDSSFGMNGKVNFNFNRKVYGSLYKTMALSYDGKIICASRYLPGNGHNIVGVLRVNPNGTIDSSFGRNGLDTLDIDIFTTATGLVVQPDGKIVVSGDVQKNEYDHKRTFLCRFMPDGGLDPGFGEAGIIITQNTQATSSNSLILRPDGKIVRGSTYNMYGGNSSYMLESFNPDGTIDAGFGENGKAKYVFGLGQSDDWNNQMYAMALQPDGKIVCTGISGKNEDILMAVCRFNADGNVDATFGDDGGIVSPYKQYNNIYPVSIDIQDDGKILTTGNVISAFSSILLLCRYTENGQLDPSFGENGIFANLDDSLPLGAQTVHYLTTGKILITGGADYKVMLMRFNNDLVLATHFKNVQTVQDKESVTISWQTLNESGTKNYSIERSSNATDFTSIATVPAKGGQENSYSYTDHHPLEGTSYYRIKENAVNGTATFSNTLKVIFESNTISLYPNPAKNTVTIKGLNKNATATIRITDMHGRELLNQKINNSSNITLPIRALAQGSYFVLIEQNGKVEKLRFVKE